MSKEKELVLMSLPNTDITKHYKAECEKWEKKYRELEIIHTQLHHAYLRLRDLIPGAYDTPYAPTPQQVWEHTERSLRDALEK
jgi:hypothetical protein